MIEPTDLDRMNAASDYVHDAVNKMLLLHDGQLVLATLLAEAALITSALREAKVMNTEYIVGMLCETLSTALTYVSKTQVVFTDGKDTGVKQ